MDVVGTNSRMGHCIRTDTIMAFVPLASTIVFLSVLLSIQLKSSNECLYVSIRVNLGGAATLERELFARHACRFSACVRQPAQFWYDKGVLRAYIRV